MSRWALVVPLVAAALLLAPVPAHARRPPRRPAPIIILPPPPPEAPKQVGPFATAPDAWHQVVEEPTSESPPHDAQLAIVHEGRTGGSVGLPADLWADQALAPELQRLGFERQDAAFGAAWQEGAWLLPWAGGMRALSAAAPIFEHTRGDPVEAQEVAALLGDDQLVAIWPPETADALLPTLQAALSQDPLRPAPERRSLLAWPLRRGDDPDPEADAILLGGPGTRKPPELPIDLATWEVRLRSSWRRTDGEGHTTWVSVVARVRGDGARRSLLVRNWRRLPSLYLSAGESIEEHTLLAGQPLPFAREVTWQRWRELGLTALAPGRAELLLGAQALREDAEAAGVHVLATNLVDPLGNSVFEPLRVEYVMGHRVALLGWTDPSVIADLPPEIRAGIVARGPEAIREVLATLPDAFGRRPDLVVVFGVGAGAISERLPGVDLVLGDYGHDLSLPRWESVDRSALVARGRQDARARGPAFSPRLGADMLGRVDLAFEPGPGPISALHHLRIRITETHPADSAAVRALQAVLQPAMDQGDEVLLPDLAAVPWPSRSGLPQRMDDGLLARLIGQLAMDRTGADLSILPPSRRPWEWPGPTLALALDGALPREARTVLVEFTGAQLRQLSSRVQLLPAGSGGWPSRPPKLPWAFVAGAVAQGSLPVLVRGRAVRDDERVLVVTTSSLEKDPAWAPFFPAERRWDHFATGSGRRVPLDSGGSVWPLATLVRDAVRELRDRDPSFGMAWAKAAAPYIVDQSRAVPPRGVLRVEGLSVSILGSKALGDRTPYASVREGRVHQQDSLTISLRGRLSATVEDQRASFLLFAQGALGRTHLPGLAEPVEVEDDALIGAEARAHLARLAVPGAPPAELLAVAQTAFDTEWTRSPDPNDAGALLPRQRVLRTTPALAISQLGPFTDLRFGLILEEDLEAAGGAPTPGALAALSARKQWSLAMWTMGGDLRAYPVLPGDGPGDLMLLATLRNEISIEPFRRWVPGLRLGGWLDGQAFLGKLPEARVPGLHLLAGFSLSWSGELRATAPLR
jgi:hypothetical protein